VETDFLFLFPLQSSDENAREIHILREQLQQQTQQTKQALAQLILVREQLLTETNARIEAQVLKFSHFLLLIKII